jgi:Tfp pilus assembly protein PilF
MTKIHTIWTVLLTLFLLTACSELALKTNLTQPLNKQLASGIKSYEDGDYQTALLVLSRAQESGLGEKRDQVLAHKYLAFIHCVSGREKLCREEFREALEVDSNFALSPAEAGHPVWGPVFKSEKAKYAK